VWRVLESGAAADHADAFYDAIIPATLSAEERAVYRLGPSFQQRLSATRAPERYRVPR